MQKRFGLGVKLTIGALAALLLHAPATALAQAPASPGPLDSVFAQLGLNPLQAITMRVRAGDAGAIDEMRQRVRSGDVLLIGGMVTSLATGDGVLGDLIDACLDLL